MVELKSNLTAANFVTVLRILLTVPFFGALFLGGFTPSGIPHSSHERNMAYSIALLICFVLISLLDNLDGYLARKRNEVTDLGKFLDPIADKFLTCGALIILNIISVLPVFVTVLVIFREVFITVFRSVYIKRKQIVIPASILGKLKTLSLTIAIGFFILPLPAGSFLCILGVVVLIVAVVLTYISAVFYVLDATKNTAN